MMWKGYSMLKMINIQIWASRNWDLCQIKKEDNVSTCIDIYSNTCG